MSDRLAEIKATLAAATPGPHHSTVSVRLDIFFVPTCVECKEEWPCTVGKLAERFRNNAPADMAWLIEQLEAMAAALRVIERGEGRFSRDPLTHASNTIDDMKEVARNILRGLGVDSEV